MRPGLLLRGLGCAGLVDMLLQLISREAPGPLRDPAMGRFPE